jgi:hypothetical protein
MMLGWNKPRRFSLANNANQSQIWAGSDPANAERYPSLLPKMLTDDQSLDGKGDSIMRNAEPSTLGELAPMAEGLSLDILFGAAIS